MKDLDQHLKKVTVAICDGLGTDIAKTVKSLVVSGKWVDLVGLTVHPSNYTDGDLYFKDAIAVGFLRKLQGLPTGIDLHERAVETFWNCEKQCAISNRRLSRHVSWFQNGFVGSVEDNELYVFIEKVRNIVKDVLGPVPRDLVPKFGKGATYFDRGVEITIPHKIDSRPARTAKCWWTDLFVHRTHWGFANLKANPCRSSSLEVRGNRFTSVPKDSEKNRGICIEPSLNLAFQLPIGGLFKNFLKEEGIDLIDGQERHRRLAQEASVRGHLATIDLSNASDTVCRKLVELLLPKMWFDVLDDLRSPCTMVGDRWVRLEKFSSMGNGYTFELETLIFYAISRACAGEGAEVAVYGDDIIVPTSAAPMLLKALAFFGFTPNKKKTFIEGPFRESCGGDFFDGKAVRPYFQNEIPTEPHHWIVLANGLRRLGVTDNLSGAWRFGLLHPWLRSLDAIPSDIRRLRGPRALGDVVIHDTPTRWTNVRSYGREGYRKWIRTWQPVYRRLSLNRFHPEIQFAAALYGVPSAGIVPRDGVRGHRKRWTSLIETTEF